jgi:hypothetical protein
MFMQHSKFLHIIATNKAQFLILNDIRDIDHRTNYRAERRMAQVMTEIIYTTYCAKSKFSILLMTVQVYFQQNSHCLFS